MNERQRWVVIVTCALVALSLVVFVGIPTLGGSYGLEGTLIGGILPLLLMATAVFLGTASRIQPTRGTKTPAMQAGALAAMEQQAEKQPVTRKRPRSPGALFDWRMSAMELQEQVAAYSTLGIFKSYRKVSAGLWLLTIAMTALMGPKVFKLDWIEIVSGSVLYLLLAVFCYRGHRWALVASMILWTVEKAYSIAQPTNVSIVSRLFWSLLWWTFYMGVFWKALSVERARRRVAPAIGSSYSIASQHEGV